MKIKRGYYTLILRLANKSYWFFLQTESLCGTLCNRTIYHSRNNYNSKFILGKERKVYGEDYYIVWAFFESMYVDEKVEHYSFTFDNLIVSIGGSLGLFLGWSLKSVVLDFIEFLYLRIRGVVPGGAGGATDFGRSVNPISTRGTDYAHLTTTISSLGFSDHPTALRMKKKSIMH